MTLSNNCTSECMWGEKKDRKREGKSKSIHVMVAVIMWKCACVWGISFEEQCMTIFLGMSEKKQTTEHQTETYTSKTDYCDSQKPGGKKKSNRRHNSAALVQKC